MKIKRIRQMSIAGIGIEVLWTICFVVVFGQPNSSIAGIGIWALSLAGLIFSTHIIVEYVR